MNQRMDTREILTLQETADGHDLIINGKERIKIIVENGKIQNDLTDKQLNFVKNYV